ncbi:MAG: DUF5702 domain-containing protein [Eubacteriaceae bacterium]|nr:DUF5702 domain-containing protein [Eubacteriaceae bacterium]
MRKNISDTAIFLTGDRKGSSSVFLMMIMASMAGLVISLIAVTNIVASAGAADSVFTLAGRSVLAEYDRDLKDDFGIFAFRGSSPEIEEKVSFYAGYTLAQNPSFRMKDVRADTCEYTLMNTEAFRHEIIGCAKYAAARGLADGTSGEEKGAGKEVSSGTGHHGRDGAPRDYVLRNSMIINGLPSKELGKGGSLWKKIKRMMPEAGKVFRKGTDKYWMNKYIMSTFKNAQDNSGGRDTFFNYEAEYILEGHYSDEKNRKAFKRELMLLRNAVDLPYILTDTKMMAEVTSLAAKLTPGPEAAATEAVLIEAWALAEAENDIEILVHGGKVPLWKTDETWAVSLKNAVKGTSGYIDTGSKHGLTYQGYLQTFLFFQDDETKIARIMDLIQINMKGTSDRDFLIRECNLGFAFGAKVNGRSFSYAHKY